jgi:integrase
MARGSVIEYRGKRGTVYRIKYQDADGKQCMETIGPDRREAEKALREKVFQVDKGYRRPKPVTLADVARRWFEDPSVRRDWRIATVRQYSTTVDRISIFFGSAKLEDVRPRHIAEYRDDMLDRYAGATVCRELTILGEIFAYAIGLELCEANPVSSVKRPKLRQRQGHHLSPEDVQILLRSFDEKQARAAFLTFVLTGIRNAELVAMRWRDVDLIENRLSIPYSKSETGIRVVSIPPMLAEELWQVRRRSGFQGDDERVFCHPERGSAYRIAPTYKAAVRRAFDRAGLEWPERFRLCHDLRVTAITTDARNGTDPIAIMANAGHASYSTTKRYVKMAGVVFPDAAEARERRLLGKPSTELSTDLSEPHTTSRHAGAWSEAEEQPADLA